MNIYGSGLPEFDGTRPEKYEQYLSMSALAHSNGCTVSINHPFCSRFGWRMPFEDFSADCVEIWNMFMHQSNMTCIGWWERQILGGRRIAAVGGSDYHRDYGTSDMLASPTTFVLLNQTAKKISYQPCAAATRLSRTRPTRRGSFCHTKTAFKATKLNLSRG